MVVLMVRPQGDSAYLEGTPNESHDHDVLSPGSEGERARRGRGRNKENQINQHCLYWINNEESGETYRVAN